MLAGWLVLWLRAALRMTGLWERRWVCAREDLCWEASLALRCAWENNSLAERNLGVMGGAYVMCGWRIDV